jgi:hypothetical protein
MLVTLFGITTLFNLMQLMKVWSFKIVILMGNVTVTKLAQLLKALDSILLTLFGIIILIKLLILLNAFEPMAVRVYTIDKYVIVELKVTFSGDPVQFIIITSELNGVIGEYVS